MLNACVFVIDKFGVWHAIICVTVGTSYQLKLDVILTRLLFKITSGRT